MVYIYAMDYYSAIKKNNIMPLAATWMEVEVLILSEVSQRSRRQIPYDITYINLKYGANEPIYREETKSWTWRTDLWLPRRRGRKGDGLGV